MVEPEVIFVPAGDALLGDPPRTEHVNVFCHRPPTRDRWLTIGTWAGDDVAQVGFRIVRGMTGR